MNGKFFWGLGSIVLAIVVLNLMAVSGRGSANPPTGAAASSRGAATSTFEVTGMTCKACELPIQQSIEKLAGVERVDVRYKEGRAFVTYDPARVRSEQIAAAIEKTGYKAKRTMTCGPR